MIETVYGRSGDGCGVAGWFDTKKAEKIVEKDGEVLYKTTAGKYVHNEWDMNGRDYYTYVDDVSDMRDLLIRSRYVGDDAELAEVMKNAEL